MDQDQLGIEKAKEERINSNMERMKQLGILNLSRNINKLIEIESKAKKKKYVVPHLKDKHLTEAQKEIIDRIITQETQEGSDLLVKELTATNVHFDGKKGPCFLRIPKDFACEFFDKYEKKITLSFAGLASEKCTALYSATKTNMRYINEGWRHFAHLNELKKRNLYLFELRKREQDKEVGVFFYEGCGQPNIALYEVL